jgi:hypothetical protein
VAISKQSLSILLTITLAIGVAFAIYQSAKEQIERKAREEIQAELNKQVERSRVTEQRTMQKPSSPQNQLQKGASAKSEYNSTAPSVHTLKIAADEQDETGYFVNILSQETTMHVIGVYEGENASGVDDPPWWSHCQGINPENKAAMMECHRKYAGVHKQKTVTVNVRYTKTPIILVVMAYEPVKWDINLASKVKLEGVVMAGYHKQELIGVPTNVPQIAFTHQTPDCTDCIRGEGYFHAYKRGEDFTKAASKLFHLTGKSISSFQGAYKSHLFNIIGNI